MLSAGKDRNPMMKCASLFVVVLLILGACAPGPIPDASPTPLTTDATGTGTPSETPTSLSPDTAEPTLTETPTPTNFVPPQFTDTPSATAVAQISDTPVLDPSPTLACERETASLVVSADSENLNVGDSVVITVTLSNEGCVALGLPQYRLYVTSAGTQPIFSPEIPEPVVHYLAVAPGQADSTEFTLTAVAGGQAELRATASYEVHLGYPGPAYWGSTGSGDPLIITVGP